MNVFELPGGGLWYLLTGLACACTGWLLPRRVARAGWRKPAWCLIDAALPCASLLLLLSATARPLLSGIVTLALGAGFAYADHAKRMVLDEPVVHSDVFQAFDIFRHPRLALPFPHKWRVLCIALATLAFFTALFRMEPALPLPAAWRLSLAIAAASLLWWLLAGPSFGLDGRRLLRSEPSADPVRDGAKFGPFATLLAYGLIAREQRAGLQAAVPVTGFAAQQAPSSGRVEPLVLIQCESFFDPRRLHPSLRGLALPALDRCRNGAMQWGRLTVPCWGANTVRTEFAVLTGLEQKAIGFDRFNPYHRFARVPIASLAWRMRAEGYRTVCLHPFDRSFYGRDRVMPNLGFDRFFGDEVFNAAQRVNGYIADHELARVGSEILREERGRVFLFVITMENHGPWDGAAVAPSILPPGLPQLPDRVRGELECYLRSIGNADAMLGHFAETLLSQGPSGVLAFYGDHLPSFPALFETLGLRDQRSDYLVWQATGKRGAARRLDLAAHNLIGAILRARGGVNPKAESLRPGRTWRA